MPMPLFPSGPAEMRFEEPAAFRRFSQSLVETALVTGVVIRLYRALVYSFGPGGLAFGVLVAGGAVFFCAMVTAHLANFPVQRWVWRAPAFAALVAAGEMVTSVLLIAVGREPIGSMRAMWTDWPRMAASALLRDALAVCLWAALLALAVTIAKQMMRRSRS